MSKTMKVEELQIDESEGKALSDSILRVSELYEIPLPSEKIMAWVMLAKTCGDVYGPRVAAVALRRSRKPKVVEGKFAAAPSRSPGATAAASGAGSASQSPAANPFENLNWAPDFEPVMS